MTYRPIPQESYPKVLRQADFRTVRLLGKLYASEHGELKSVLQLKYHLAYYESKNLVEIEQAFGDIIADDLGHLDLLAKTFIALGVDPIYTDSPNDKYKYFSTASIAYTNGTKQMLLDDITLKIQSVRLYKQVITSIKDAEISLLLTQIKQQEEFHLDQLKKLHAKLYGNKKGAPNE